MKNQSKKPWAEYINMNKNEAALFNILRRAIIFLFVFVIIVNSCTGPKSLIATAYGQSGNRSGPQITNNEPNLTSVIYMAVNFSGDHLEGKDLSMKTFTLTAFPGAQLQKANLRCSAFVVTDFSGTQLQNADMSGAAFVLTNLSGAQLQNANLSGTKFRLALFAGAQMQGVNLEGADLSFANIRGINNWRQIRSMQNTNIYKIKNAREGFIDWAKSKGAVSISPNDQ
jgi:hypothetical protein